MTTPVSGASGFTPVSAATAAAGAAKPTQADPMGKDTFLKLLVAQLKYQDPMNPADGTQFLAQTAQFTTVEKLGQIAAQNDAMIQAQNLLGASSLVGRTVSYLGSDGQQVAGVVGSVRLDAKGSTVRVDGTDVPIARVTEVRTSQSATPGPPTVP